MPGRSPDMCINADGQQGSCCALVGAFLLGTPWLRFPASLSLTASCAQRACRWEERVHLASVSCKPAGSHCPKGGPGAPQGAAGDLCKHYIIY